MSTRPRGYALAWVLPIVLVSSGCGLLFSEPGPGEDRPRDAGPPAAPAPATADDAEAAGLPTGLGTLRQEQISVMLRRGELQLLVTPLAESVTRTAAPDTWERLSSLGRTHREILREETGTEGFRLFLVALYSDAQTVPFEPEDLSLVSRGLRFRPVDVRGLTPGWDRRRVAPRETQLGVYAFPPQVELAEDLEVEYQEVRSREWERLLPAIEAERARIRARAGGPG